MLPNPIQAVADAYQGLEYRIRELTAENAALRKERDAARAIIAAPADLWGVKVWNSEDGSNVEWSVTSNLGISGAISRFGIDLRMDHEFLALHTGRMAGGHVAAAVEQKVGASLADFLRRNPSPPTRP